MSVSLCVSFFGIKPTHCGATGSKPAKPPLWEKNAVNGKLSDVTASSEADAGPRAVNTALARKGQVQVLIEVDIVNVPEVHRANEIRAKPKETT